MEERSALRRRSVLDVVLLGDFGRRPGEHRHRAPWREHRDQPAGLPATRSGAGLPGLLRAATELELLLLRRHVLGLPGRQLVRELLVQRPVGARRPAVCAAVRAADPGALLPCAAAVLSRVAADAPPRWGEHWGNDWAQQRRGWDQWNRKSAPAPAPLPSYQRQYSGDRYPHQVEQQQALRNQNYRYQPRDAVVQQHYQAQPVQSPAAPGQRDQAGASQDRGSRPQDAQRASPQAPGQHGGQGGPQQRGPTVQDQGRPPPQGSPERPQEGPKSSQKDMPQGKGMSQAPQQVQGQGQGQAKGHDKAGDGGKP